MERKTNNYNNQKLYKEYFKKKKKKKQRGKEKHRKKEDNKTQVILHYYRNVRWSLPLTGSSCLPTPSRISRLTTRFENVDSSLTCPTTDNRTYSERDIYEGSSSAIINNSEERKTDSSPITGNFIMKKTSIYKQRESENSPCAPPLNREYR